jgi:hypothetical protein
MPSVLLTIDSSEDRHRDKGKVHDRPEGQQILDQLTIAKSEFPLAVRPHPPTLTKENAIILLPDGISLISHTNTDTKATPPARAGRQQIINALTICIIMGGCGLIYRKAMTATMASRSKR